MRVLMTSDTIGGVWTYALELCRALRPHGVEVAVATMGNPPTPDQQSDLARLDHVQLFQSTYKLEWMDDPWDEVDEAGQWLMELEEEISPDVIHLNGYAHGSVLFRAPVLVVGHSCVLSWWQAVKKQDCPA